MHQRVVFCRDRPGELASNQVVRDIAGQAEVGKTVQQVQGEEQIGGHPIAVGLEVGRDSGAL